MGRERTRAQQADQLYTFIHEYLKENAKPPNQREMAEGIGASSARVQTLLRLLDKQGRAIYRVGRHRQVWPKVKGGLRGDIKLRSRLD